MTHASLRAPTVPVKIWRAGKPREALVCCAELAKAFGSGTDGEGYGSLIDTWRKGFWTFGLSVAEPVLCPWCGAPNNVVETESEFTEGVAGDGAVILRNGVPMTIKEVLAALNKH